MLLQLLIKFTLDLKPCL